MLTDPDRSNMTLMMHAGELATWPTVHLYMQFGVFRAYLGFRGS